MRFFYCLYASSRLLFILLFALVDGGAVAPGAVGWCEGADGANYPTASSSYKVSPGNSRARRSRLQSAQARVVLTPVVREPTNSTRAMVALVQ